MTNDDLFSISYCYSFVSFKIYEKKRVWCIWEKPTPINTHYESEEGDFVIKGNKDKFFIVKDNGLVFEVVNGQIVSVTNNSTKHIYEVN